MLFRILLRDEGPQFEDELTSGSLDDDTTFSPQGEAFFVNNEEQGSGYEQRAQGQAALPNSFSEGVPIHVRV